MAPPVKAAKRQRSAEEAKPSARRPKKNSVTPAKSFAEVARNRIVIGVLDEGDPGAADQLASENEICEVEKES